MSEDVRVLREILQRELETINAYEQMLSRVQDPVLREIIQHVTDEEREHVAEMYELIVRHDPVQRERNAKARPHLSQYYPEGAPEPGPARDPNPPPAPVFPSSAWSVGPLRNRP